MAPLPPPHGMSEADYETIEAAVTETVRGRWFLGEFARRNRTTELRQVLDAMARLETVVSAGQQPLLPADPSIRLLMQRIKEIATQLEGTSAEMRDAGIDPRFVDAVGHQSRAVAGMMRGPAPDRALPRGTESVPARALGREPVPTIQQPAVAPVRMPKADLPAALTRPSLEPPGVTEPADQRLAALSALDGLTLAKKLALFS